MNGEFLPGKKGLLAYLENVRATIACEQGRTIMHSTQSLYMMEIQYSAVQWLNAFKYLRTKSNKCEKSEKFLVNKWEKYQQP